jgi:hypothetical protein
MQSDSAQTPTGQAEPSPAPSTDISPEEIRSFAEDMEQTRKAVNSKIAEAVRRRIAVHKVIPVR